MVKKFESFQDEVKIEFLSTDDWQGIYIDGELKNEGHNLTAFDVLKVLKIKYDSIYVEGEEFEELFGYSCPDDLETAKAEIQAKKYNL